MNSIICLMILNRVKQGHAVTFMKYLASAISIIFLPKILNWNKIMFLTSNSLNLAELAINEPMKNVHKNICHCSFFYSIHHSLM